MDIDTIQLIARDLERSLDSWSSWLELATALVVIGLFSEYWYEMGICLTQATPTGSMQAW
jgi:hypothetical protein